VETNLNQKQTFELFQSSGGRTESESESLSLGGGDNASEHSSSPLCTPHITKRKSIHDRKLRPKSVVDQDGSTPGINFKKRIFKLEQRQLTGLNIDQKVLL